MNVRTQRQILSRGTILIKISSASFECATIRVMDRNDIVLRRYLGRLPKRLPSDFRGIHDSPVVLDLWQGATGGVGILPTPPVPVNPYFSTDFPTTCG